MPESADLDVKDGKQTIDLTGHDGDAIPAIYELKGESLTICWNRNGGGRPDNFRTEKGDGRGLFRLKRVDVAN